MTRQKVRSVTQTAAAVLAGAVLWATAGTSGAQSQVTLQTTSIFAESDFSSDVLRRWAGLVEERTEGRVGFRYYYAGSLVGNKTLDGLSDGVVDVAVQFTPYVSGDIVDLAVLDIPFSFPLDAEGLADFHQEVRPIVSSIYSRYNSRVVSAAPIILPNPLTCNDRFLSSSEKWEGALVRVAGRWQAESVSAWGGSPVVIPPGELYSALDRGTVNCTLMVYNGVQSMKLYEVAPKVTRIDHSIAFGTINVSDIAWARLSEEDREIMVEAGDEVAAWASEQVNKRLDTTIEDMAADGAEFCTPDQAEFDRLVSAVDSVIDSIRPQVSEDGAKLLEIVDAYRPRVTSRPTVGPVTGCPN